MKHVVVLIGSMRSTRAADKIYETLQTVLDSRQDINYELADVRELQLPFIDTPVPPSDESFVIPYESVKHWRDTVAAADGVLMLTPEYNAGMSGAHKNAIDWLYAEWHNKPVAVIGYGWSGAARSRQHLSDTLARIKAREVEPAAALSFTKEIEIDGQPIDKLAVREMMAATVQALAAAMKS